MEGCGDTVARHPYIPPVILARQGISGSERVETADKERSGHLFSLGFHDGRFRSPSDGSD